LFFIKSIAADLINRLDINILYLFKTRGFYFCFNLAFG